MEERSGDRQFPRPRNGATDLFDLRQGQLLVLGLGFILAVGSLYFGEEAFLAKLLVAVLVALGSWWLSRARFRGRGLDQWVPVMAWHAASHTVPASVRIDGVERVRRRGDGALRRPVRRLRSLGRIDVLPAFHPRTQELMGVVHDYDRALYVVVMQVMGGPFVLLSREEQAQLEARWGDLLRVLARETSPVSIVQWLQRTHVVTGEAELTRLEGRVPPTAPRAAVESYRQLIAAVGDSCQHELFLVLGISERDMRREIGRLKKGETLQGRVAAIFADQTDTVRESLRSMGVKFDAVLQPNLVRKVVRDAWDPGSRAERERAATVDPALAGVPENATWPNYEATPALRSYGVGEIRSTTFGVTDLGWGDPVPTTFITPLLIRARTERTVSVVMRRMSVQAARNRVRRQQSGHRLNRRTLEKRGFEQSAAESEVVESALDREGRQLAQGAMPYDVAMFVTVVAPDEDTLLDRARQVLQDIHAIRCEGLPLTGQHDIGWTTTLPLGRGI